MPDSPPSRNASAHQSTQKLMSSWNLVFQPPLGPLPCFTPHLCLNSILPSLFGTLAVSRLPAFLPSFLPSFQKILFILQKVRERSHNQEEQQGEAEGEAGSLLSKRAQCGTRCQDAGTMT